MVDVHFVIAYIYISIISCITYASGVSLAGDLDLWLHVVKL